MKPLIVLPPDQMSAEDIAELRENGFCVVISKDPATFRFVDPIPAAGGRTDAENAAIQLSRRLLHGQWSEVSTLSNIGRPEIASLFVRILLKGTSLDKITQEEREERIISEARAAELIEIGREEARAARAAKKKAKEAKEPPK